MVKKEKDPDDFLLGQGEYLESMFNIFPKLNQPYLMQSNKRWIPAVDVFETDDEFVLIIDIAQIDPSDISLSIQDNNLILRGVRNENTKFNKRHYHKMEIDYGPFERSIHIPVTVNKNSIKTHYRDGFMEVRLQKIDDRRGGERAIKIEWED